MKGFIALLLAILCFAGLKAKCPDPDLLVDDYYAQLCAQMFEYGSDNHDDSCNGKTLYIYRDEDTPIMPWVFENRISSLVVGRDCILTVWSRSNKKGDEWRFWGGVVQNLTEVKRGEFETWNDSISSYYCTCHGMR